MAVPGPPVRRHSARLHEAAKKTQSASKSAAVAAVAGVAAVAVPKAKAAKAKAGKAKAGSRLVTYSARRVESRPSRGPKLARAKTDEEDWDASDGGDESDDVYPTRNAGSKSTRSRQVAPAKVAAAKVAAAKVAPKAASKRPARTKKAEPPPRPSKPSRRSALKRSGTDSREAEAPAEPPVAQQDWGAWLTSNRINVKMLQPQASKTREAATSHKRKAVAAVASRPGGKSKVQNFPASKQSKPTVEASKSDRSGWWALPEVSVDLPLEELCFSGPPPTPTPCASSAKTSQEAETAEAPEAEVPETPGPGEVAGSSQAPVSG
ncbi:unnamed protein product [Symbiodinium sp. CCMP2456]|nr:unnamed protein product [Symbiodinium sp. CCMP2456]